MLRFILIAPREYNMDPYVSYFTVAYKIIVTGQSRREPLQHPSLATASDATMANA